MKSLNDYTRPGFEMVSNGAGDNQRGLIDSERESARIELVRTGVVDYCPGAGWPVFRVLTMERFELLQECSKHGVRYRAHWQDTDYRALLSRKHGLDSN